MITQLFWFRNDLRIEDNTGLIQAINQGPTVAIYVATPEQWLVHDDAPIKIDFWYRNLQELHVGLQQINVPLYFFQVPTYAEIPKLFQNIVKNWKINSIHCNAEYPLNERKRDEDITTFCESNEIEFHCYEDQCLLPPDFVLTAEGSPFKVFTPYARKCKFFLESTGLPKSNKLSLEVNNSVFAKDLPALDKQLELNQIDWPQVESCWLQQWPAGEKEAMQRLNDFVSAKIKKYKTDRDYPAINGTSSLSPYLASGVISVRVCWEHAKLIQGESSQIWCNELLWRDFYRYVMYHYPHVCAHQAWNRNYANIPWREKPDEFKRWCDGETGFPIIDAAMKQLQQNGWMHNRLRMVVAMFLSKNLLLDWRWGERWFMQHLIDGDFASNNGGWQWSASTGTDAAPYFRIFNPIRQSERFDATGEFIKMYIPELLNENTKNIHDPAKIQTQYFSPMIDLRYSRERALAIFKQYKGSI
jgi:deoxyribodipyrimidine photo-lyase